MWPRRHRSHPGPLIPLGMAAGPDEEVVAQACAVVEGRALEQRWGDGQPIPAWVWLNALAHRPLGDLGDLVGMACDQPDDAWAGAVIDVALYLSQTDEVDAARIQAELLVPAELDALAGQCPPDSPGRLARAVRRLLVAGTYQPRVDPRNRCPNQPEA